MDNRHATLSPVLSSTFPLGPVLELQEAQPLLEEGGITPARYNLTLEAGECALIECHDSQQASYFTDICAGMVPLGKGQARCLGLEWAQLDDRRAWALRGRIGRIAARGGWIDLYGMHMNILWPRLHHTRISLDELMEQAVRLGFQFGLPGLPTQSPDRLSMLDRRRSEYVRAFLGEPSLLLLEDPVRSMPEDLYNAFLSALTSARERGCAVVWISAERSVWRDYQQETMQRFRLSDDGLIALRGM